MSVTKTEIVCLAENHLSSVAPGPYDEGNSDEREFSQLSDWHFYKCRSKYSRDGRFA